MNKLPGLEAISVLGLPLGWDVVRLGWEGVGDRHRLVSLRELRAYADQAIGLAPGGQVSDVSELCMASGDEDVGEPLRRLAPDPSPTALRVWRAVLLERLLGALPAFHVDLLCELTDFWRSFAYPADSPHVIQGRDSVVSPEDYYTEETATRAVAAHQAWLRREIEDLRRSSAGRPPPPSSAGT